MSSCVICLRTDAAVCHEQYETEPNFLQTITRMLCLGGSVI